jgi:membrane protein DedA with SNARE-associated domain
MTDTLFSLVADYGLFAIAASAFLSCLLVPIPTSLLMLAGGAFAAAGDLSFFSVAGAAWLGAVAGDQTGFRIGRAAGARLDRLAEGHPHRAALLARAGRVVDTHGGLGVFFSTWAVAPLGPYVNLAAGAGGLGPLRFTLWDAVGEAIWVLAYAGLGYAFADRVEALGDVASNASGFLTAGAITVFLGVLLLRRSRRRQR